MLALRALALLSTLVAAPVQKGKWVEIGKTSTGNPVFVSPRSILKAKDGIITAAFRVPYAKPFDTPKGPVKVTTAVAMFDCAKKQVAVKESTMYLDDAATRVYQHNKPKIPGFGPSFSSTFSGVALDYLCAKG